MPVQLAPTFADRLRAADRPLFGGWVCSGSSVLAEIMAGAGLDWLLIDMEHAPNDLASVLGQLQAIAAYEVTPVVRVASADPVTIKQVLDLGAQNIVVPMVQTASEAGEIVAATRYPPAGIRGVGSALARSGRWARVPDYLPRAGELVSVVVQIESSLGAENSRAIAEVPGIDGIFVGPSDLAASLGRLGEQAHPEVVDTVLRVFGDVTAAGKAVGVNAFDPAVARRYAERGAAFVLVGADVSLVARGSEQLARDFVEGEHR